MITLNVYDFIRFGLRIPRNVDDIPLFYNHYYKLHFKLKNVIRINVLLD